jgi:plastocyanin
MKSNTLKSVLVSVCLLAFSAAGAAAATNTIYIFSFGFGTTNLTSFNPTINLGDTVTWVWTNGHHSSTATPGQLESWDSGQQTFGTATNYSHTFTNLGTYYYYCTVHSESTGCRMAQPIVGMMTGYVAVVSGTLTTPYQVDAIVQQGSDIFVDWITGGICMTNVLQRSTGNPDGSFNTNFVDIFEVDGTTGNNTNFIDAGAATNFPSSYYRVRVPQ